MPRPAPDADLQPNTNLKQQDTFQVFEIAQQRVCDRAVCGRIDLGARRPPETIQRYTRMACYSIQKELADLR